MTIRFLGSVVRSRRVLLVVGALGLCGCAVIGPRSVSGGRGAYAEVINTTENEQLLNALVRLRYGETFGMISVASVTASLRFSAQAGTNIGIGDSDNYAGNLVPLSVGVAYEENPTISYVPLKGADFLRRMVSPVPIDEWLLLGAAAPHPGAMVALTTRRLNGLRNSLRGQAPPSPGFARLTELYDRLRRADVLEIVQRAEAKTERAEYFWQIQDYEDAHGDSVRELLDLLGIDATADGSPIVLPLRPGVGRSSSAIYVQTRSAYDVLQAFGTGIEVPAPDTDAGVAAPLAWTAPEDLRPITIHASEKHWWPSRPEDASVAVRFRDRWFYIEASDTRSKRAFVFLRSIVGMRMADPVATQQLPVLTVGVN